MALTPGLLRELQGIVGPAGLVVSREGLLTYECDMHTFYKGAPEAVVLPESSEQVAAVVRLCRRERVPRSPGSRARRLRPPDRAGKRAPSGAR